MKNIGVFFGSGSTEHDISIITGQLIVGGLKGLGYQVTPVYLTKQGKWMLGEDLGNLKLFTSPNSKPEDHKDFFEYYLDMQESIGKLVFKKKGVMGLMGGKGKEIKIDMAFPAFHGTYGEDGTFQGMMEMLGVPYVGCNVPASAVAMDKALTKIVMKDVSVPTTKFVWFTKNDWDSDIENCKLKIENSLKFPLFVKPVHLGSSIGIGKAKDEKELVQKIEVALHYDNKVIVEEAVENLMDVTCCLIGNENPTPSLLQESIFKNDLLNFEDKYLNDGGAQLGKGENSFVIPARLDEQTTKAIQDCAVKVYKAVGMTGIGRVDFLFNKQTKEFFANEINPLPGTIYHHLWKASGVELDELLKRLIKYAQEVYDKKREVTLTFESSVLTQLNGLKGGAKLTSNK
jgi:D-alanine-D-alanine ligase